MAAKMAAKFIYVLSDFGDFQFLNVFLSAEHEFDVKSNILSFNVREIQNGGQNYKMLMYFPSIFQFLPQLRKL